MSAEGAASSAGASTGASAGGSTSGAQTQDALAHRIRDRGDVERLDFAKQGGLIPQVAQDARTGEVLMLGYASPEAVTASLTSGELWFWSRQRQRLWKKGETSGNSLRLVALHADCDADALLALVVPSGPTCHAGSWSCFEAPPTLAALGHVIAERAAGLDAARTDASSPDGAAPGTPDPAATGPNGTGRNAAGYTGKLLQDRNLRLKKLGEEAVELALACSEGDAERAAEEAADLLYHSLVACQAVGVGLERVLAALGRRLPAR